MEIMAKQNTTAKVKTTTEKITAEGYYISLYGLCS
jgi:hypothetical protein